MQLGEGVLEQQAAAGVGPLCERGHGGVQRRPRVWVLPHRVLRQQAHMPCAAAPGCRTHSKSSWLECHTPDGCYHVMRLHMCA